MKKLFLILAVLTYTLSINADVVSTTKIVKTTTVKEVKPDSIKKDTGKLQKVLTELNNTNFEEIKEAPESGAINWMVWIATTGLFIINIIVRIIPTANNLKILQIFTQIFKLISKISGWLSKIIPDKKKGGGTHE